MKMVGHKTPNVKQEIATRSIVLKTINDPKGESRIAKNWATIRGADRDEVYLGTKVRVWREVKVFAGLHGADYNAQRENPAACGAGRRPDKCHRALQRRFP